MADANWFEQQYYPSLSIAGVDRIFESWNARAMAARTKLKFTADIQYGPHRREVMDFYSAKNARGCVVFIHGGYWLSFSKFETSWVAQGFVGQGLSVALLNYPLCPEVSVGDIRISCIKAFVHLYKNVLSQAERQAIVVTGHSAGGYLAAAHLTEDWVALGLPADPIAGVLAISGVFDLSPLMQTGMNVELQITEDSARALNLNSQTPRSKAKLALAVGQEESSEFHRQASALSASWASLASQVIDVSGTNHFTIVDDLAAPDGQLNKLAAAMAQG